MGPASPAKALCSCWGRADPSLRRNEEPLRHVTCLRLPFVPPLSAATTMMRAGGEIGWQGPGPVADHCLEQSVLDSAHRCFLRCVWRALKAQVFSKCATVHGVGSAGWTHGPTVAELTDCCVTVRYPPPEHRCASAARVCVPSLWQCASPHRPAFT
ncbi:hypothetical protein DQ04_08531010 [Trypanosoma grayi]|uniref:hypothetical protein n=1 Tax=Trypanosoma grayi TaxID=71804 RepID=UPI0004F48501|nr:hypothetical protein DQ04_08531010 [Trypanosoma grayi]KEG07898.1 hypothetical protein DQ04_08531010 [Trypanosoma grayi]